MLAVKANNRLREEGVHDRTMRLSLRHDRCWDSYVGLLAGVYIPRRLLEGLFSLICAMPAAKQSPRWSHLYTQISSYSHTHVGELGWNLVAQMHVARRELFSTATSRRQVEDMRRSALCQEDLRRYSPPHSPSRQTTTAVKGRSLDKARIQRITAVLQQDTAAAVQPNSTSRWRRSHAPESRQPTRLADRPAQRCAHG